MHRFLLRPLWILSHLLVLTLVVAMIGLGLWQLRRHDERREQNQLVEARAAAEAVPIADAVSVGDDVSVGDEVRFTRVSATGEYLTGQTAVVTNRSVGGRVGSWVVTPLDLGGGEAVLVNRGFIPELQPTRESLRHYAPADGAVTVEGLLQASIGGPSQEVDGVLSLVRPDVESVQEAVDLDLYPVLLQVEVEDPSPAGDVPSPVPAPDLGSGTHLSYAGQWAIFAVIAGLGYVLILRRVARAEATSPGQRTEAPDGSRQASSDPQPDSSAGVRGPGGSNGSQARTGGAVSPPRG